MSNDIEEEFTQFKFLALGVMQNLVRDMTNNGMRVTKEEWKRKGKN